MNTTLTAHVSPDEITITETRGSYSAPIFSLPLPEGAFDVATLNNLIRAKGFEIESAWAIDVGYTGKDGYRGLRMQATLVETS